MVWFQWKLWLRGVTSCVLKLLHIKPAHCSLDSHVYYKLKTTFYPKNEVYVGMVWLTVVQNKGTR